jgi:asparagine synthetase B (glutamine-hydrolysing)
MIKSSDASARAHVVAARNKIKHEPWYQDDDVFEDGSVLATRTHLNVIGEKTSPVSQGGDVCWVEGEVYNFESLKELVSSPSGTFPELLLRASRGNELPKVLAAVDGYYTAVIYNRRHGTVRLISDRYGLKPLYVWHQGNEFCWASELKAFLAIPTFAPVIRQDAFDCFMELRHMIGDITWFEHVTMMRPATILTYEIERQRVRQERYWSWSRIRPQQISFQDAAAELGRLLGAAVAKRADRHQRTIVGLSGGLDSRLLLAASDNESITGSYTVGIPESPDVITARRATALKNSRHWLFELNADNWLDGRSEAVWRSDGMRSFIHIHEGGIYGQLKEISDISLNGYLGDVVAGGSWMRRMNKRISADTARWKYKQHYVLDPLDDPFFDIDHEDPYLINNRGRRATNMGLITGAATNEQRIPFFDNDLIQFLYTLPDEYRAKSRLYKAALLGRFPEYFENIPWQKTGLPISKSPGMVWRIRNKARKGLLKFGLVPDRSQFVDYKSWIRAPKASAFFEDLLGSADSLYRQYTKYDFNLKFLQPHLAGNRDYREEIGRAATVEIWLRRVFGHRW